MKKILALLAIGFALTASACDNCNVFLNLSPNDYKNSISLYARHRMMYGAYSFFGEMTATRHTGHGNDIAFWGEEVYENYLTYELRGNYYFRPRWRTSVIIPISHNFQRIGNNDPRYALFGVGDPILMQSYQVFNTRRDTGKNQLVQRLEVGGGIKFPLGKTDITVNGSIPNLDLQPGSGSWDGLTFVTYALKHRTIGINIMGSLKWNGRDKNNYRYGTTANISALFFKDFALSTSQLRVQTGAYSEFARVDQTFMPEDGSAIFHYDTGGRIHYVQSGMQLFTKRFVFFGNYQYALKNTLNGYTQLLTRFRINTGITYNF